METETSKLAEDESILYKSFSSLIIDQLNVPDVNVILDTQRQILLRLEATNRNLAETTQISTKAFNTTGLNDLQAYINLLTTMKQDLDFIFKRIRVVKSKLETKYPEKYANAFNLVRSQQGNIDDEEEEEEENLNKEQTLTKDRADSNESTSSALAGFIQTARNRISTLSGKDLVNGLLNSAQLASTSNLNTTTNSNDNTPYIEPPKQDDS